MPQEALQPLLLGGGRKDWAPCNSPGMKVCREQARMWASQGAGPRSRSR